MRTLLARVMCCSLVALTPALLAAQTSKPPFEISAYEGTWTLDETATQGLIGNGGRSGGLIDRIGFPAARTLVVTASSIEISVGKDGRQPELYRFDGIDRPARDERTGAYLRTSHRFMLVAGMLALTQA